MYQKAFVFFLPPVYVLSWLIRMLFLSTGKELENLALEVGFSKGRHYEIGGGLMGNLVAIR